MRRYLYNFCIGATYWKNWNYFQTSVSVSELWKSSNETWWRRRLGFLKQYFRTFIIRYSERIDVRKEGNFQRMNAIKDEVFKFEERSVELECLAKTVFVEFVSKEGVWAPMTEKIRSNLKRNTCTCNLPSYLLSKLNFFTSCFSQDLYTCILLSNKNSNHWETKLSIFCKKVRKIIYIQITDNFKTETLLTIFWCIYTSIFNPLLDNSSICLNHQ